MTISPPDHVVAASEGTFRRLRNLRDRVMESVPATEPAYPKGHHGDDTALAILRVRMREDLHTSRDGSRR
ncbi:hypothetical protein DV517_65870 [Streptomyces sp. S816]|nr:hypothetical protein DV517_65870 [Streptomyces sp. S816]